MHCALLAGGFPDECADALHLFVSQLIGVCENVLVRGHQQLLWDEFQSLLDTEKADGAYARMGPFWQLQRFAEAHTSLLTDLFRIYTLLSRVHEGLDPLRETFEGHVKRTGLTAVEKVAGEAGDSLVSDVASQGRRM